MAERSDELCEKNSSRTLTLDKTIQSPDGFPISIVVTAYESQSGLLLDLLDNAEEYFEWIHSGRMGETPPGMFH